MRIIGECIEFPGYKNRKGYGQIKIGGRKGKLWLAHRWAWAQAHGDPGDLCVLHACDNPACVNVEHLFLGTIADNNRDMCAKGRHRAKFPVAPIGQRPQATLTLDQARQAKYGDERAVVLARRFGVSQSTISHIRRGRTWVSA